MKQMQFIDLLQFGCCVFHVQNTKKKAGHTLFGGNVMGHQACIVGRTANHPGRDLKRALKRVSCMIFDVPRANPKWPSILIGPPSNGLVDQIMFPLKYT